MSGGALWGAKPHDPAALRIAIDGICNGCVGDELVYALHSDEISGVFRLRNKASEEERLLHTADFHVRRLHASRNRDRLACVLARKTGNSCIAIMRGDGSELTEVTQGDAVDDAPHWLPGASSELVFQSAAIGRDQNGLAAGQAPFTIQKLNLEAGEVVSLAEDPDHDLLTPQISLDGALYYIRRPYRSSHQTSGFLRALLDLVLMPFRLLYALFQYLNFFTARYTGNTLTSAGGARQKNGDLQQLMIWGNLIDAQKAAMQNGTHDRPALVPKTWELVRQSGNGSEVVARSVLSFDLCGDGSVLYSDGSSVFLRNPLGRTETMAKDALIEQVILLAED